MSSQGRQEVDFLTTTTTTIYSTFVDGKAINCCF
jgi:hypothetical protein